MVTISKHNRLYTFFDITVIKEERQCRRTYLIKLLNAIEYIDKVTPSIVEAYKVYDARCKEILDNWNINLLEFNNTILNLSKQTDEVETINKIFKYYRTCIYCEGGKYTPMKDWLNNFITPTIEILKNYDLEGCPSIKKISILINRLRIINAEYQDLKKFHDVFNRYYIDISTSQKYITQAIDYFSNKIFITLLINNYETYKKAICYKLINFGYCPKKFV